MRKTPLEEAADLCWKAWQCAHEADERARRAMAAVSECLKVERARRSRARR